MYWVKPRSLRILATENNGRCPPPGQTEIRNVTDWVSTCSSILITWFVLAVLTTEQMRMSSAVELTLIPLYCPILLWEKWATSLYLGQPYHQRFALSLSYVQYTTACHNSTVTWTTLSGPTVYLIYYILSYLTHLYITKARVHIRMFFFNILLTVHLNIFIYQYRPTWCTKFYNKFISSLYMFRAHVLIVMGAKLYYTVSGIITPIGGRPVHRLTEDCIIHFLPSWRWAQVLETCRGLK